MPQQFNILTPEDRAHFLANGWIKISQGIPQENVQKYISNVWTRLGWDKNDVSTWVEETVHMPSHREISTKEFMPKAYYAACELVGGEEMLDQSLFSKAGDGFILNVGTDYWKDHEQHPRDLGNWHIDGDWFTHYLDSGDQALVVICLYTDVESKGGATFICPKAIPAVTKYMHDHPEGGFPGQKVFSEAMKDIEDYTELTGKAGDVFLAHPFMPHSRSRNSKRSFRAITNPPCTLKEPLNLNRPDGDYTLVEQVVLDSLGKTSLPEWKITGPRERFSPRTGPGKLAKVNAELERMQADAKRTGIPVDSVHLTGEGLQNFKLYNNPEPTNVAALNAVGQAIRV